MSTTRLKISLINPPVLAVLEPWYDTPDFVRTGLAYLAGYLRQFEGFEIQVIDAKFERFDFEEVLARLNEFQPDVVGFTAYTNEIKPAAYLAARVKEQLKNCITVIGGVHVTAIPTETLLEFHGFDIGVVGEGEVTLQELCEAVHTQQSLDTIDGLVIRKGGSIHMTSPRLRILDQESIPFPAWDMFPKANTYFIQTIRGCPFDCKFCMNPNGKVARKRSVPHVIEELKLIIDEFNPERISFGDELFSVDMERTNRLLDAMAEHKIGEKVKWDVQTHVRYVDLEMMKRFKIANVERVELGIETGDEAIMKKMGKGISMEQIKQAYTDARKAKVEIGTFFLIGQPNETPQTIMKTIRLAGTINPELPMFGLMTPYPGTEVSKLAAKGEAGYRLLTTDWDEYNKQIGGAMEFANLSRRQIEWYQIYAYLYVFIRNFRMVDLAKFIWEYRKGVFSVVKKVIGRKKVSDLLQKPADYDAVLQSNYRLSNAELADARDNWKGTQTRELKRAKKASPELFNN